MKITLDVVIMEAEDRILDYEDRFDSVADFLQWKGIVLEDIKNIYCDLSNPERYYESLVEYPSRNYQALYEPNRNKIQ